MDRTGEIAFNYLVSRAHPFDFSMSMRSHRFAILLTSVLLAAAGAFAHQQKQSLTDGTMGAREMSYSYKWEGPRFYIRLIEIDIRSDGIGELRFTRGESDEVLDCKVKLQPSTISRIRQLFESSGFLN